MKVALCLSGQPRSFKEGFLYHEKNLLKHYDVDVFMHTWSYVKSQSLGELSDLYSREGRHKVVLDITKIDNYQLAEIDKRYLRIPNPQFPARNTWQMWYSIFQSINMVRHPTDYDVIIRSRYDYALNVVLPLRETRVDMVYVPSDRMTPNHDFCADMFAWGTPSVMLKYARTFTNISKLYEEGSVFIGEDLLDAQLKNEGLIGRSMAYVDMNNPFPPGQYNGNTHS